MSLKPTVIGITGPFGSGKTTAASFFKTKGYYKITLSSFLEDELDKQGKEITRRNLQDLANSWREKFGSSFLAKKALEYVSAEKIEKVVVDGVRNLGEVEYFKANSNFILLGIVADRSVRFQRIKKLKNREELNRQLFDQLDLRDLGITQDLETGLQVAKCLAVSDYFINSNDENRYQQRLEEFLRKIS